MKPKRLIPFFVLMLAVALGASAGINSSQRVESGEIHDGDLSTLNGGIRIGDGATIHGDCESVNGSIQVGADVRVEGLSSVNGSVEVGERTVVADAVESVNCRITLDNGAQAREVTSVNGKIELNAAEVEDDVTTINGDITLTDGATVSGSVLIEESGGNNRRSRPLRVRLEGGSTIEGDLIVKDKALEVEVYLSDGSRVNGRIENAQVIEE